VIKLSVRRATRRHRFALFVIFAIWLALIVIAITVQALGSVGWAALTTLIGLIAWLMGTRHGPVSLSRISVNRAYGQMAKEMREAQGRTEPAPVAYRGGQYPPGPGPMDGIDVVSAYPAALTIKALTAQVTDALNSMGYPKASIDPALIRSAIARARLTGSEPTVQTVLQVILREAGEAKSRRLEP
jgi:hypothetical protein